MIEEWQWTDIDCNQKSDNRKFIQAHFGEYFNVKIPAEQQKQAENTTNRSSQCETNDSTMSPLLLKKDRQMDRQTDATMLPEELQKHIHTSQDNWAMDTYSLSCSKQHELASFNPNWVRSSCVGALANTISRNTRSKGKSFLEEWMRLDFFLQ